MDEPLASDSLGESRNRAAGDRRHGTRAPVDRLQRLADVQRARLTIAAEPIPVVEAEGGVARLLHLGQYHPAADGVDRSRGQEHAIARRGREGVQAQVDGPFLKVPLQDSAGHARFQPRVDPPAGLDIEDHPGLRLAELLAGQTTCLLIIRVDLDREQVAAIEELDQQREPALGGNLSAEECAGMGRHRGRSCISPRNGPSSTRLTWCGWALISHDSPNVPSAGSGLLKSSPSRRPPQTIGRR